MRRMLQIVSCLALAFTVVPSFLFLNGTMELEAVKTWMLAATVVWFVVTPFWMGKEKAAGA